MKHLFGITLTVVLLAAAINLAAAVCLAVFEEPRFLDNMADDPDYIVYQRYPLTNHASERYIILGASNTREGFRSAELSALLGGADVVNFSLGGAGICAVETAVRLIEEATPQAMWPRTTIVVGAWFGMFSASKCEQGMNAFERHMGRSSLYLTIGDRLVSVFPEALSRLCLLSLKPFLALRDIYKRHVALDDIPGTIHALASGRAVRPPRLVGADTSQLPLEKWPAFAQSLVSSYGLEGDMRPGFERLQALAERITAHGGRFLVVDLPLPRWHEANSPHNDRYQALKSDSFQQIRALPGCAVVDMKADCPLSDDDFADPVHPRGNPAALKWSRCLAHAIRSQ